MRSLLFSGDSLMRSSPKMKVVGLCMLVCCLVFSPASSFRLPAPVQRRSASLLLTRVSRRPSAERGLSVVLASETGEGEADVSVKDLFQEVDEDDFDGEVLDSDDTVFVMFSAAWCGPCRILGGYINQVVASDEFEGKFKLRKVSIDDNPNLAVDYDVRNIPTCLIFRGGEVVASTVGGMSKGDLKEFLRKGLGS